jgi:hypothetical protein
MSPRRQSPEQRRSNESPDQIRVDCFLIADSAQVVNDKLFMLGGGWNIVTPSAADGMVTAMSLAGRIVVPLQESDRDLTFSIHLEHADGESVLGEVLTIQLRGGAHSDMPGAIETATPFALDFFGLIFPRPGEYAFVLRHEGIELARTRFHVSIDSTTLHRESPRSGASTTP